MSAFLPYPSPLITSGLIQYGVPVTDFMPVPDRQMVCSRLLAPKSPSFTLPTESLRMFAPEGRLHSFMLYFSKTTYGPKYFPSGSENLSSPLMSLWTIMLLCR